MTTRGKMELREMFQYVQSADEEAEWMREKEEKFMREMEKKEDEMEEKEVEYMREKKRKRLRLRAYMKMPESEKMNYIELKHRDIGKGIAEVKKAMKAWRHEAHKKAKEEDSDYSRIRGG